jgi:3-isopropylmalate/(R)-2-methylmalate dehydratase small subunit
MKSTKGLGSKNYVLKGRVFKYGDNVDTDVIIPARYLNTLDPDELAGHCMEDMDKDFASKVKKGDIIVAGDNFGCGSSREHAPLAIKASGVSCVIASSFARIFFRNSINIGLPILECPDASPNIKTGDELSINLEDGTIENTTTGKTLKAEPFPEFMRKIIEAGGLINRTKQELEGNS